jgi:NAD(P)-dependent dehydrogenase (short-subunit alcohol dehydrogenase family)
MASHGDAVVSGAAGGGYAYRASKAALNIISKALALDLAPRGVAVTSVHPGWCGFFVCGVVEAARVCVPLLYGDDTHAQSALLTHAHEIMTATTTPHKMQKKATCAPT